MMEKYKWIERHYIADYVAKIVYLESGLMVRRSRLHVIAYTVMRTAPPTYGERLQSDVITHNTTYCDMFRNFARFLYL